MTKVAKDDNNLPVTTEETADQNLVETAYNKLIDIISEKYSSVMMESGQYIIDTFYDGDFENARKKISPRKESLNSLITKMHDQNVSKAWIYNAVDLVVIEKDMGNFLPYRNLKNSHKVLLLRVKDVSEKKRLSKLVETKKYSARKLKEEIDSSTNSDDKSIFQVAKNPKVLFAEKFQDKLSIEKLTDVLKDTKADKIKSIEQKIKDQIKKFKEEVEEKNEYINKYKKLSEDIKTAKKSAK